MNHLVVQDTMHSHRSLATRIHHPAVGTSVKSHNVEVTFRHETPTPSHSHASPLLFFCAFCASSRLFSSHFLFGHEDAQKAQKETEGKEPYSLSVSCGGGIPQGRQPSPAIQSLVTESDQTGMGNDAWRE